MKPISKIEPCETAIPESLLRAAERSERRRDDVINRVLLKLGALGKDAAVASLIDGPAVAEGKP